MAQSLILSCLLLLSYASDSHGLYAIPPSGTVTTEKSDTITDIQSLYNGRIWQNYYYMIREDQFLFSKSFLPGSVTISGKTFTNVRLRYDILNDELLIPFYSGGIMQLNKEMIDSFSFVYSGKEYRFLNFPADSSGNPEGYFNVLYKGKSELLIKYIKKIEKLSDGKYDSFYGLRKIFILKDGKFYLMRGRKDAMMLVQDKKSAKSFIKSRKLDISNDEPESYIPLLGFIDKTEQNR